jgi:hypothetical protein
MSKPMTPGRIQRLAKNPATRAALADKYLSSSQLAQRNMNKRLSAPVVQGSGLTNRDLAHQAQNAVQVQYGSEDQQRQANIAALQQRQGDTGSWFDNYQKDLLAHAQAIQANNASAGEANKGLVQAAGQVTQFQGTPDAQVAKDAENASAIRQALTASFGALMNAQGANASNYADTQAHVVAPGQKLTALQQAAGTTQAARDQLATLKGQEGAANADYRSKTIAAEQNSVLAQQALTGKTAAEQTTAALKAAALAETARHNKAAEKNTANDPSKQKTQAELDFFDKHGYWPPTGPPTKDKAPKPNSGQGWATGEQQGQAQDKIGSALSYASQFKSKGLSRAQAAQVLVAGKKSAPIYSTVKQKGKPDQHLAALNPDGTPKTTRAVPAYDPLMASVALDMAYDGHVSKANVKKLHARGIRIDALGYPTRSS